MKSIESGECLLLASLCARDKLTLQRRLRSCVLILGQMISFRAALPISLSCDAAAGLKVVSPVMTLLVCLAGRKGFSGGSAAGLTESGASSNLDDGLANPNVPGGIVSPQRDDVFTRR